MNFTYYKFLFLDTIKRKSVWITWLLYLFVVLLFLIILPIASTLSVYQLWSNTTIAICQTFVGLAVAIFTAVLAINVFKNSNEEGTELIIISKPISRVKIVFTKFIMFFSFCLLVNLTAVLITCFTIFLPNIEKKFYWGLVVSMFIGNLVTFGVFGAIASLLSIRFAKAGIIVTNVVISIVLFAYQVLSVFVFSTSFKSFAGIESGSIVTKSYILPIRQEDGSFKEEHFVDFVSSPNKEGEYEMKVLDWAGVKEYWDKENAKTNQAAIIASDIGTQFSLSYLTAGVNGYSDRQATRMYNFSRYYTYDLTKPASPEYFDKDTGLPISNLKFVYSGTNTISGAPIRVPARYYYPGVRSTKASYLKGTITDDIPIADLQGKDLLAHYDVSFNKDEYKAYSHLFDIMYDNIFKYDIKNGNGDYYWDFSDSSYTIESLAQNANLNIAWSTTRENVKRFYRLVWACLTGHHGDNEYFGQGSNDPLDGYTIDDFNIKSVYDLNCRYLQFKDYCFYKVYDEQHELMVNGIEKDAESLAFEKTYYSNVKDQMEKTITTYGMTNSGIGIGDYGFTLRALHDGGSEYIQPGTQTINTTLLYNTYNAVKAAWRLQSKSWTDPQWLKYAQDGSYAKWIKTGRIMSNFVYYNEYYLFDDLKTPERNDNWTSEQYITAQTWYPYYYNVAYAESGVYLPFGQNLELSMYECHNRVQFWWFAVIWGCMAMAAYAVSFIVYNKYDIK